jgi:hypothetical protein
VIQSGGIKMRYKLPAVLLGALLISLLFIGNGSDEYTGALTLSIDEISLSFTQLVDQSDVIVGCKYSGKKETEMVYSKDIDGPVKRYKMKKIEVLKGSIKKDFTMIMPAGLDDKLQKGEEYALFLNINPDETYRLVSYRQGLLKTTIKKSPLSAQSPGEPELISYRGLKKMIEQQCGKRNSD